MPAARRGFTVEDKTDKNFVRPLTFVFRIASQHSIGLPMDANNAPVPPVPAEPIQYSMIWWAYGWPVIMVVQVACLVHVVRTGRPFWWFWIIMAFPFLGAAAYVLFEVRPAWGRLDWHSLTWRLKNAAERIRIRESQFDASPAVNNRLALAAELHAHQQFDRECEVLAAGLVGAFRNDTTILLRLAEAHLASERSDEAESCLNRCTEQRRSDEELTIRLMQARILSVKGQFADADALFLGLAARRRSEAPRFYHAESLRRAGRAAESRELLTDICKTYRRGTTVYRKREREWFVAARQLQKSMASQRG